MRIETKRLIIRNFELKDEEDLGEYMLQRVNAEFEQYKDFTKEKVPEEIRFRMGSDEFYAIELKSNHKVIGNIYMGHREFGARELGFVLNEDYQKKGYGSEAAKAAVEYFIQTEARRIFAECCPMNAASWKTMEKIGMKREAHFRENVSFRKTRHGVPIYWDTYVYAVLETDYKDIEKYRTPIYHGDLFGKEAYIEMAGSFYRLTPEIFKAYRHCTNGKELTESIEAEAYWKFEEKRALSGPYFQKVCDPEKLAELKGRDGRGR